MKKQREQDIIQRILGGDADSFRELLDVHSSNVFSMIYKIVGSREDAEELAQDVFVKAFFSLKNFKGDSSFSTWLYRIAYNASISKVRKKERLVFKDDLEKSIKEVDLSEERVLDKEIIEKKYEQLETAVLTLSPEEKFFIVSFYENDKSLNELTMITGLSLSNVKIKMFRAKKKLMAVVKKEQI